MTIFSDSGKYSATIDDALKKFDRISLAKVSTLTGQLLNDVNDFLINLI